MDDIADKPLSSTFRLIAGKRYYVEEEVLAWLKGKDEELKTLRLENAKWRKRNRTAIALGDRGIKSKR